MKIQVNQIEETTKLNKYSIVWATGSFRFKKAYYLGTLEGAKNFGYFSPMARSFSSFSIMEIV